MVFSRARFQTNDAEFHKVNKTLNLDIGGKVLGEVGKST